MTQPRRIAATSICARVCSERGWEIGKQICGYQIGLDRRTCEDTLITYVTTGVLLQKLVGPRAHENFETYTHIILDEVHERDLDSDLMLLIIKLNSYQKLNPKLRIILMSATIQTDEFIKYFSRNVMSKDGESHLRAPQLITIKTPSYKVTEFYWDDLLFDKTCQLFLEPTKRFKENLQRC